MATTFSLRYTRHSQRDLKRLNGNGTIARTRIDTLSTDPFRGHPLTGPLEGYRALRFSLPGSGEYRAVYRIEPRRRICLVVAVLPREDCYGRVLRFLRGR